MNVALLKNRIRYAAFFIPFRFHLLVLSLGLLAASYWLKKTRLLPDSSYSSILDLFLLIVIAFMLAVLAIAFTTAIIPWLFFLFNKRRNKIAINVKTITGKNSIQEKQQVGISISPVFRPLFGYIRLRLHYDDENISPKFSLVDQASKKHFLSSALNGIFNWHLPRIKEYSVSDAIIYFEDMFQFFSFAATLPAQDKFFTQPKYNDTAGLKVQPKKPRTLPLG